MKPAPRPNAASREAWRTSLAWWVLTRPTVIVLGYLALLFLGYGPPDPVTTQRLYDGDLVNLPARWDSFFYHEIATRGCSWNGSNVDGQTVAYFPGFPLAMRAVAWLTGLTALWAGVLVSVAAFLPALVYLYRLTRDLLDAETARSATLLLATYPGAVFFSAAYTESLFLLACLGAFHHVRRGQPWIASAWSFVAGLTRLQGFLLCLPLAWMIWRDRTVVRGATWGGQARAFAPVVAALLGVVLFSVYMAATFGRPLLWLENQVGWGPPVYADLLEGRLPEAVPSTRPITLLDRVAEGGYVGATVFAIAVLPSVARWLGFEYCLFAAACFALPLLGHGSVGMTRYTAVAFPAFIVLARFLGSAARVRAVAVLFFAGQAFGAAMFFTFRHFL